MTPDIVELTNSYSPKGIFLDTNVLLLMFIGLVDRSFVPRFKRTKIFVEEDFDTLSAYLNNFARHFTTPNVLTEVSNLTNSLSGKYKVVFSNIFVKWINVVREEYVPSRDLATTPELPKFGLADSSIATVVKGKYLLLTDDFALSQYLQALGCDVVNFNHLRIMNWD